MFLELIATFAAGAGAAGIILLLNRVIGGRLPGWLMPAAAGLAMILVTVANEYSWAERTAGNLPDGVTVVEEIATPSWYRPWSFVAPPVLKLIALDTQSVQTNAASPDVRLVDLYFFARWRPNASLPQLVNCATSARAMVSDAALADPSIAPWVAASASLIEPACKGGAEDGT